MNARGMQVFLVGAALFLSGCRYEAPLTLEHSLPIDTSVLGLWQPAGEGSDRPGGTERLLVLQYSETEYLIHYSAEKDPLYFRGYPIRIGDVPCVQLQLIGIGNQPVGSGRKDLFHVAAYTLRNGLLVVSTLNGNVVSDSLKDSGALAQAFVKHKDNRNLFTDPCRFRKIPQ